MFLLEISTANDFTFAVVVMFWGMGALIVMCLACFITETIADAIGRAAEKRRRKNFRKGYIWNERYK